METAPDLIHLDTRPHTLIASQSRTVVITNRDGWLTDAHEHGVFIHETQVLSQYHWKVLPSIYTVEASNVQQNSTLVYCIARPGHTLKGYSGSVPGQGNARNATEETIELAVATIVSDGFHQDIDLHNYSLQAQTVHLEVEYDASFADLQEVLLGERHQKGERRIQTRQSNGSVEIRWDYQARHRGNQIHRSSCLRFHGFPGPVQLSRHRLRTRIRLEAGQSFHCCVELAAVIDQNRLTPSFGCYEFYARNPRQAAREAVFSTLATFPPAARTIAPNQNAGHSQKVHAEQTSANTSEMYTPAQEQLVVQESYLRSVRDLSDLRIFDLDRAHDAWVPAAGIPIYVATFGRDILTAAWQSAMVTADILRGALGMLRELQGKNDNPWRDEEPGKMLHEAHTGPLAVLDYLPQGRYYGSFNTSPFYAVVLSEFYHWTGDRKATLDFLPSARAAMAWMDKYGHPGHKHFYAYRTRSSQGVKNQGWKDSNDAMIDTAGNIVPDPLATCAVQGFAYEAKVRMAELLWLAGERREALHAFRQARELKKRFNDVYWMPEERYFAMAIDPKGRLVRSIGSDAGDALASGIIDAALVEPVVQRLFSPELFSGWGIRTLSSQHVAFNPYSYHRGSVWPAENAAIAVGLRRYGFTTELNRLARAQFHIAERFHHRRLPEVFSGHARERQHPFPAVYPRANAPQAWSSGAVPLLIQMIAGLYPYAPAHTLFVHPDLPEWLPELTLQHLAIGEARVSLRFRRNPTNGKSEWEVIDQQGKLRIIQQPSPWSVHASAAERLEDLLDSLAA